MVEKRNIRRSISAKIFLIFFSSLAILFCFIIIILAIALDSIATGETFYRLRNYTLITSHEWRMGEVVGKDLDENNSNLYLNNLGIIQGIYINNSFQPFQGEYIRVPENILAPNELAQFLSQIQIGTHKFEANKGTIYYNCDRDIVTNNFIVFLIDDSYNENFSKKVIFSIIIIITIALIFLAIITGIWVSKLVKRIRLLQDHVNSMNKNRYENEYLDDGDDEIRELSESIEEMRMEIKDSETTKREMLQNVSHDFKTPIAVIKNYGEAIVDGVIDKSEASVIVKQANLLKSKVNQLLQYNRLEYLQKDQPFKPIDMQEVVKEVAENHRLNNTGITFELCLEECIFMGYRENYDTVIENIVDNALRYAKSLIRIETKKNKVTIYNDGEPIEDKFLDANFKPYEKGSKGEFGLGMSIVKKTLDFFDLKLRIYNEPKGGVSFVIYKDE